MSLGFLIERDQPAIWRGPIVMKIVTQFLRDVDWGTLDYLLVDMPPGTGDAQLSLVQATHVHGAVIVTTPQPVSTGDALRGAKMFERVNVPVLGIVENMSYLLCAHCGKPTPLFGSGGGRALADELARSHPGAAASLREGLEENVTVPRLGIKGALKRTLATNPCEPMIECVRRSSRNVKHWQSGDMASPPNRSPDRHREVPRRPGHPLETSTASLRMGYA